MGFKRVSHYFRHKLRRTRRGGGSRRASARRSSNGGSASDKLTRGVAVFQSAAILLDDPLQAGIAAKDGGGMDIAAAAVAAARDMPWSRYFEAQAPPIAAEGGIAVKKIVKRVGNKVGSSLGA